MLINIFGKYQDGQLQFDLPSVYFERESIVCVNKLFIKWKQKTNYNALILSSTLVEKSPTNPLQQLLFTHSPRSGSNYTFDTPTHKNYYKIQCLDLQASVFKFTDLEKDLDETFIKKVFIQLEIFDARVQSST